MKLDLIFNPIIKSKWRKTYLILLSLFTSCTLFIFRGEFNIHSLNMLGSYFILFYLFLFFPITFLFFTFKWCWKRHGFLTWEEVFKIIIYALILFITYMNYFLLRSVFDPNYYRNLID